MFVCFYYLIILENSTTKKYRYSVKTVLPVFAILVNIDRETTRNNLRNIFSKGCKLKWPIFSKV